MVVIEEIEECNPGDDVDVKERGLSRIRPRLGLRKDVGGEERFKSIQLNSNQNNLIQLISTLTGRNLEQAQAHMGDPPGGWVEWEEKGVAQIEDKHNGYTSYMQVY